MNEVKSVKVFASIGKKWTIDVELRKPIARIFNQRGESFYLDNEGHTMQPSELHTARVVVVNGFIPDRLNTENVSTIINNDSLISIRKLDDIYRITNYVCNDPLLHAQIAQIFLEKSGDFVLTPQIGGHRIVFGSANTNKEVSEKFQKLKTFYKEAIPYEGWNKYSEITLKYENQIVCKKKN
jgi:cell division protein FtsQ